MAISSLQGLSNLFLQSSPTSFVDIKNNLSFGNNNLNAYTDALNVNLTVSALGTFFNTLTVEVNIIGTPNDGSTPTGADNVFSDIYKNGSFEERLIFGNNLSSGTYSQTTSTTFSTFDFVRVETQGQNDFGVRSDVFEDTYGQLPTSA
jgi:vesicle coat complex subunit